MSCPHCGDDLAQPAPRCPHCGRALQPETVAVAKTATVRMAEGEDERVYRSIAEIPPEIRRKIQKAIHGPDADTIIITNPEGREKILEVIQGLPPQVQRRGLATIGLPEAEKPRLSTRARIWVLLGLMILLVILLWWTWSR